MGLTDDPLAGVEDNDAPLTLVDTKAAYRVDPIMAEISRLIDEMDEAQRLQLVGVARVLLRPPRIIGGPE